MKHFALVLIILHSVTTFAIVGASAQQIDITNLNKFGSENSSNSKLDSQEIQFGFSGFTLCPAAGAENDRSLAKVDASLLKATVRRIDIDCHVPKPDFGRHFDNSLAAEKPSSDDPQTQKSEPKWNYGGFVDVSYILDFNHPENRIFRSRGTTWHVDAVHLNNAAFYVRKKPTDESRWGVELTAQTGKDTQVFGFSATAPNIAGYRFLRHLGPTNVSYLAPVGKGLTVQAGIFSSFIGYDSFFAKDNFNYTRPWGADFTPYYMMGVNATYPVSDRLTVAGFVVNGYWHLARANSAPSFGGQVAYKVTPKWSVKETVLTGSHQRNTGFAFWRFLTDTIVESKTDKLTSAFEYIYSGERVDTTGRPLALMMAWQMPTRWTITDRWSLSFRPEVFWDRDGRWTLAKQTVKAFTTTVEYRIPYKWTTSIFRLEYRWDDSRGPEGGFFRGAEISPGVVGLTPSQHLLIFATIFAFDK
jgi:hypothetical protein